MQSISLTVIQNSLQENKAAYIAKVEQAYWQQLSDIAEKMIMHQLNCPILLLSGPSGSGKTMTAMILASILKRKGVNTHTLSMDHYFQSMSDMQRKQAEAGKLNLETPERLNIPLLNTQLADLRDGKPVALPRYDFRSAKQIISNRILCRKPKELVILEGIHALNPSVIALPQAEVSSIYVDIDTALITDAGQEIQPKYIRLLRRIVRDQKYRKRSVADTIRIMPSIQAGEAEFIAPFRHRAVYQIDTFLSYETFVYHKILKQMPDMLVQAKQVSMLSALFKSEFDVVLDDIPHTSLIREFIGDSVYDI